MSNLIKKELKLYSSPLLIMELRNNTRFTLQVGQTELRPLDGKIFFHEFEVSLAGVVILSWPPTKRHHSRGFYLHKEEWKITITHRDYDPMVLVSPLPKKCRQRHKPANRPFMLQNYAFEDIVLSDGNVLPHGTRCWVTNPFNWYPVHPQRQITMKKYLTDFGVTQQLECL